MNVIFRPAFFGAEEKFTVLRIVDEFEQFVVVVYHFRAILGNGVEIGFPLFVALIHAVKYISVLILLGDVFQLVQIGIVQSLFKILFVGYVVGRCVVVHAVYRCVGVFGCVVRFGGVQICQNGLIHFVDGGLSAFVEGVLEHVVIGVQTFLSYVGITTFTDTVSHTEILVGIFGKVAQMSQRFGVIFLSCFSANYTSVQVVALFRASRSNCFCLVPFVHMTVVGVQRMTTCCCHLNERNHYY